MVEWVVVVELREVMKDVAVVLAVAVAELQLEAEPLQNLQ